MALALRGKHLGCLWYFSILPTGAVTRRCSVKKVFLKIWHNSQENTCARIYFLIKLQACNFIKKETLAQVFSCVFCKNFQNTFFYRTPPVAASLSTRQILKANSKTQEHWPRKFLYNEKSGSTVIFNHKIMHYVSIETRKDTSTS